MRFGKAGAWSWTRLTGGSGDESARGVAVSARDDIFLGGDFAGTLNGHASMGGTRDLFAVTWGITGTVR